MSQYSVAALATLFFCLALFTSVLADAAGERQYIPTTYLTLRFTNGSTYFQSASLSVAVKCYNDSAARDCNSSSSYLEQNSARKCCVEIPNSVSYMTKNNECKQCIGMYFSLSMHS